MFRNIALSTALLTAFVAGPVFAEANANQAQSQDQSAMQSANELPQELKQKLTGQGFTNIEIVPGSYIVDAKDKQGDPVTMILGPNSMTVFTFVSSNEPMKTGSVQDDSASAETATK